LARGLQRIAPVRSQRLVAVLAVLGVCSGCHYIMTFRTIAPMFEAPRGTKIALISLDAPPPSTCDEGPSRDQREDLRRILADQFKESSPYLLVDRADEGARAFPVDVPEPIVMKIEVRRWPCNSATDASLDIVFSTWTRDGVNLETQNVRGLLWRNLEMVPGREGAYRVAATHLLVDRGDADLLAVNGQDFARNTLGRAVAMFVQRGYGEDAEPFTAQFEHDDVVAPGIRLAKRGRFDDAIASWQEVLRTRPAYARALFNIGMLLTVRGRDRAAIGYLEAAVAHGATGALPVGVRDRCRERIELLRPLVPVRSAP
jgi:hypothetical protein